MSISLLSSSSVPKRAHRHHTGGLYSGSQMQNIDSLCFWIAKPCIAAIYLEHLKHFPPIPHLFLFTVFDQYKKTFGFRGSAAIQTYGWPHFYLTSGFVACFAPQATGITDPNVSRNHLSLTADDNAADVRKGCFVNFISFFSVFPYKKSAK